MAAGSFGIPFYEIDHIFQLAKDKNYSNHGEIFSGLILFYNSVIVEKSAHSFMIYRYQISP